MEKLSSALSVDKLSSEELKKADFLMDAEYILLQVDHGQISIGEGYQQLINLLGEREIEAIVESMYERAALG